MTSDPLIGLTIAGQYLIESKLGEGGMGCVYLSYNQKLGGRPCAIKILLEEVGDSKVGKKRFEEELKIISQLRSPHIVQVTDRGELADGRLFIVMELLEGEPLSTMIKREGALPLKRVIPIIQGILAGLSEAHQHGIIHRDLKPANIFITRSVIGYEIAKVLDFGIAKSTGPNATELTQSQQIMGTPRYMTPEQFLQEPLTLRTDLYAAGLLFYEMLAGSPPFTTDSTLIPREVKSLPEIVQLMWLHLNAMPDPIEVPEQIWGVCQSLLAKKQEDRPTTATEIINKLNELKDLPSLYYPSTPISVELIAELPAEEIEEDWSISGSHEITAISPEPSHDSQTHFSGSHVLPPSNPSYPSTPDFKGLQAQFNPHQELTQTPTHNVFTKIYQSQQVAQKFSLAPYMPTILGVLIFSLGTIVFLNTRNPETDVPIAQVESTTSNYDSKASESKIVPIQSQDQTVSTSPTLTVDQGISVDTRPVVLSAVPDAKPNIESNQSPQYSAHLMQRQDTQNKPDQKQQVSSPSKTQSVSKSATKVSKGRSKYKSRSKKPKAIRSKIPVVKSVSLQLLSRGMFFAPGSTLSLKSIVNPSELGSKVTYVIHPKQAATIAGDQMKLANSMSTSTVLVKACVHKVCSLPIKVRVAQEDAPE